MRLEYHVIRLLLYARRLTIRDTFISAVVLYDSRDLRTIVNGRFFGFRSSRSSLRVRNSLSVHPCILTLDGCHYGFGRFTHPEGGFNVQALAIPTPLPQFLHYFIEFGIYQSVKQVEILPELTQLLGMMFCYLGESALLLKVPVLLTHLNTGNIVMPCIYFFSFFLDKLAIKGLQDTLDFFVSLL